MELERVWTDPATQPRLTVAAAADPDSLGLRKTKLGWIYWTQKFPAKLFPSVNLQSAAVVAPSSLLSHHRLHPSPDPPPRCSKSVLAGENRREWNGCKCRRLVLAEWEGGGWRLTPWTPITGSFNPGHHSRHILGANKHYSTLLSTRLTTLAYDGSWRASSWFLVFLELLFSY